MGAPYVGYENLLPDAAIIARVADSIYAASNLNIESVFKVYRSADRCINLDGSTKYLHVGDHADFKLTTAATIEILFKTHSTLSGFHWLLHKANAGSGYGVVVTGAALRFYETNSTNYVQCSTTLSVSTWYRAKIVYDGSAGAGSRVTIYLNGVDVTGAETGTIPASLTTNAVDLGIGATSAGGNPFQGLISYVGISGAVYENGGYLNPSVCAGYWEFLDDLTDSSGNSHTLTGTNIAASDYEDCTAYQWIRINNISAGNVSPTYLFVDRRHNLSTGATAYLHRLDLYSAYNDGFSSGTSTTITAGEPVILAGTPPAAAQVWWLEINDPDNTDGYIEIPYVYLGSKADLALSFGIDFEDFDITPVTVVDNSVMGERRYQRAGKFFEFSYPWNLVEATGDLATWRAVRDAAVTHPFIFSLDGTAANTYAVTWQDVQKWGRKGSLQGSGLKTANMIFRELPGGLNQ